MCWFIFSPVRVMLLRANFYNCRIPVRSLSVWFCFLCSSCVYDFVVCFVDYAEVFLLLCYHVKSAMSTDHFAKTVVRFGRLPFPVFASMIADNADK